jgi:hypothetical protein
MTPLLTPAHGDLITRGLRSLTDAVPIIDAAEASGVDVSEYRAGHAEMLRRFQAYQANFFPNQVVPPLPQGVPNANP